MLTVEIRIKRANGEVLIQLEADAMQPFLWGAPLASGPLIENWRALDAFEFKPQVRDLKP